MQLMLLLSGDRANFTTVAVDLEKGELKVLANYPAPYNVSWAEPVSSHGNIDRLVGLSEGEEAGLLFTFEIDHAHKTCRITSQQPTLGAPAHIITLQDKSALAIGTYLGGSASLYPRIPNVLYASNRWERHIAKREPHLKNVPTKLPQGDTITIILLSDNGRRVQETKHVRTNLDTIRGFRLRYDGNYVVVVGQEGGGIEIYSIGGVRGDLWTLTASLSEGLESGIKHAVWL
ncbi:hypothetical protein CEP53_001838 [Fusarium sp. AF-6]|nr:hypothetical protein CEP53_001838 [Fusarium sp. AF-6]